MKKKLLPLMLLAGGSLFAETHFSVGIGVGAPAYYPPAAVAAVRPPCPGPDYSWVDGYWADGAWVAGYWAPPAYYAAPRYREYRHDWDDRDHDLYRDRYRDHDRDRDRGWDHDRGYREGFRR